MCQSKAVKTFVSLVVTEVRLSIRCSDTTYRSLAVVAGETLYFTGGDYTFRRGDTNTPGTLYAPSMRLEGLLTGRPHLRTIPLFGTIEQFIPS